MNKALLAGNILLLGIVVVMSGFLWAPSHRKDPLPSPPEFKSCYDCGNDKFYGMTLERFMTGIARYRTTHSWPVNHENYMDSLNLRDARACWFSLDTLEKYICLIKRYSAGQGLSSSKLGVRFYYAVYPSDPGELSHPGYISHHTLFMVPTHVDTVHLAGTVTVCNIDFDPRIGVNPLESYFRKLSPKTRITALDLGSGDKTSQMAQNQGQLCPPNCPPGTLNTLHGIDSTYPGLGY